MFVSQGKPIQIYSQICETDWSDDCWLSSSHSMPKYSWRWWDFKSTCNSTDDVPRWKTTRYSHQTLLDPQLLKLARVIQNGWGENWGDLDADFHAFWIHRFIMHIANSITMNGTRIVVPKSLQQEYLQCLHMGHLGISKCRARAKTTVFPPNIDWDISQLIRQCEVCHENQHAPLSYDEHSVEAHFPSHIYGADLCDIDGKVHVVCVDYFSFFIWERPLPDMQSDTVILGLKMIFSENGSPEIITDNGRSFISEDFKQFAMEWSFVHKTSSPRHPKGNAHAEWAVGIVKEVYTKCKDDFLLGLLMHCTTPLLYMKSKLSPAELFFGRRLVSNLPVIHNSNPELVAERQPLETHPEPGMWMLSWR